MRRAACPAPPPRGRARHAARRDGDASVEPLAGAADHRHAALPRERRGAPLRRLAQQLLRAARPHGDPRRRPRRRGLQRAARLSSRAARALGQLAVRRERLHRPALGAHRRSSRRCSRAAGSRMHLLPGTGRGRTSATSARPARSPSTRRSGGACGRTLPIPTVEIRICDGQPQLGEASRSPRCSTRRRCGSPARSTRASRCRTTRAACSRRTSGGRSASGCPAS